MILYNREKNMSRHDGMKRETTDPRAPLNGTAEEFKEVNRNKLELEINVPTSMLIIMDSKDGNNLF